VQFAGDSSHEHHDRVSFTRRAVKHAMGEFLPSPEEGGVPRSHLQRAF
jgi:hypothetical protein